MKTLLFLLPALIWGSTTLTIVGSSPTEAVLRINNSAPTGSACTVAVATDAAFSNIIPDDNTSLFTNANSTTRGGGSFMVSPSLQYYKIGQRGGAQTGLDGNRYSRALTTETAYYVRTSGCDSGGNATMSFVTPSLAFGILDNDGIPTDPNHPGEAMWPDCIGANRSVFSDPQTGARITCVTVPGDMTANANGGTNQAFNAPIDSTGTWTLTSPFTYSSTNQKKIFFPTGVNYQLKWNYDDFSNGYLDFFEVHATGTSSTGSILNACLTADGATCWTATQTSAAFSGSSTTKNFGGSNYGLTDWTWIMRIDHHMMATHVADVNFSVNPTTVTYVDGSTFKGVWGQGTPITFSGSGCSSSTFYVQASATNSDQQLTINTSTGCTGTVTATINAFGVLLWANSSASSQFSLSSVNFDYQIETEAQIDSSAVQDYTNSTGGPEISMGGSCKGYLAYHTQAWYIESTQPGCLPVYLGQPELPYTPPNFGAQTIPTTGNVCTFDPVTPLTTYCGVPGFTDLNLVKVVFTVSTSVSAPQGTIISTCGTSPCITVTSLETSATFKLMNEFPVATGCCLTAGSVSGQNSDGTFQVQYKFHSNQGFSGIEAIYNPATSTFIAARDTRDVGGGIHSVVPCHGPKGCYGQELGQMADDSPDPLGTSTPNSAGGPYYMRSTSGFTDTGSACPSQPVGNPLPAVWWPGGGSNPYNNRCSTFIVTAPVWEDPSPYSSTIQVTVTNGSANVTFPNSDFIYAHTGRPVLISGTTYNFKPIANWTSVSSGQLTGNFGGTSGTYTATVYDEPLCSQTSTTCDVSTHFALRAPVVGDAWFVGAGTGSLTNIQSCFDGVNHSPPSECGMILIVGKTCSGTTNANALCVQRSIANGDTLQCWPNPSGCAAGTVSIYMDQMMFNYPNNCCIGAGWNSAWDYINFPNGQLPYFSIDLQNQFAHNYLTSNGQFALATSPIPFSQTLWNGNTDFWWYTTRAGSAFNWFSNTWQPVNATAPFNGILGFGSPAGYGSADSAVDDHPTYPYISQQPYFFSWRNLVGDSGVPTITTTNPSGTLYKFSAAQQGCASGAACVTLWKTLPTIAGCGTRPMLDVSGGTIDGTAAHAYEYMHVVNANEGISGTVAGDLLVNCPGASMWGSFGTGSADDDGGQRIDIEIVPSGAMVSGIAQTTTIAPGYHGELNRFIGHDGSRTRWFNSFPQARSTPDGLGIISQVAAQNSNRTVINLTALPRLQFDSVNRTGFIKIPIQVNAAAAYSWAQVEWGYAEFGDPQINLFCTSRADQCESNSGYPGSGDPFNYATQTQSPTACASGCTVNIYARSAHQLWYRIRRTDASGNTLAATAVMPWGAIP